jgi:hypothetical protein
MQIFVDVTNVFEMYSFSKKKKQVRSLMRISKMMAHALNGILPSLQTPGFII